MGEASPEEGCSFSLMCLEDGADLDAAAESAGDGSLLAAFLYSGDGGEDQEEEYMDHLVSKESSFCCSPCSTSPSSSSPSPVFSDISDIAGAEPCPLSMASYDEWFRCARRATVQWIFEPAPFADAGLFRLLPPHGVPGRLLHGPLLPPPLHGQVSDALGGAAAGGGVRVPGGEDGGVPRAGAVRVPRRRRVRLQQRLHPAHGAAGAVHAGVAHGRRHATRLPPLPLLQATPRWRYRRRARRRQGRRPHLLRRGSCQRAGLPAVHRGRRRRPGGSPWRHGKGGAGIQAKQLLSVLPGRQGRRARLLQQDAELQLAGDAEHAGGQETAATQLRRQSTRRVLGRRLVVRGQQQEAAGGAAGRRRPMRSTAGRRDTTFFFAGCPTVCCADE